MSDIPPPSDPQPTSPATGSTNPSGDQVVDALKGVRPLDLAAAGLALSAFLWSFLPYYTVSVKMAGFNESDSVTAWHGFFGWFATLLAVVAGAVLVLHFLSSVVKIEALASVPVRLVATVALGVALLCVIIAFFVTPGADCAGIAMCEESVDFGRGIGWYLSFLAIAGSTVLTALSTRAKV